jgi:hypothetical protein
MPLFGIKHLWYINMTVTDQACMTPLYKEYARTLARPAGVLILRVFAESTT